MEKTNYQKELDKVLGELATCGAKPKLLLHSCCGPCSSYCLDYLKDFFEITVFYFNPNIYPKAEFNLRLENQKHLIEEMNRLSGEDSIGLIACKYDHGEFTDFVKGLEGEPEGGERCRMCFRLRLERTAEAALEGGFDYFGTTLTVSPHKDEAVINSLGEEIAREAGSFSEGETAREAGSFSEGETAREAGSFSGEEAAREAGSFSEGETAREAGSFSEGETAGAKGGAPAWLPSDFKKKDGYKKSIELSRRYGLYRQSFCGCEFAR